ncbi:MAG TPA: hypothetical protein V6D17_09630, partial [Candidatus Obscuribacterales bacterium]
TKNRYDHSSVQLKLDLQRNYTLDYLFSARFPCGYLPISGRLMLRFTRDTTSGVIFLCRAFYYILSYYGRRGNFRVTTRLGGKDYVFSLLTAFRIAAIMLGPSVMRFISMEHFSPITVDEFAPGTGTKALVSQAIADTWRPIRPGESDSDTNVSNGTTAAIGAVLGGALVMLATRGRSSAFFSHAIEGSRGLSGRLRINGGMRNTNASFSVQHEGTEMSHKIADSGQEMLKRAASTSEQQTTSAEASLHPQAAEPLSANEQYYTKYVDALPIKHSPEYLESGHLVPGVYRMKFDDFAQEFGNGPHRRHLLDEFGSVLEILRQGGVKEVHVGGSFVTRKAHPNDIDFFWDRGAGRHDEGFLSAYWSGTLLRNDPFVLKQRGLHMFTTPPEGGTYKGLQHFFAHHRGEPRQAVRRGMRRTVYAKEPNGIVELDLSAPIKRATDTVSQAA